MSGVDDPGIDESPPGGTPDGDRSFEADGRSWTARVAGDGLGGTGRLGIARYSLVHFVAQGETAPRFQALIASGRFELLHDRELADLLASAQPLEPPGRS